VRRLKAVPKHMDATPRYAAEGLYVFPRKQSFPIGDLYHARMALVYALSPSLSAKRKKVVQAVASEYPEYNWASWWNSRRKKGVKTWGQLVGQSQAKKLKRQTANPRRRNTSSRTFTIIVKPYESGMSDETVTVKASTPQEAVNILQGRFDFGSIGLDASYHPHTVSDDKGKRYGVGIGEDDEYVVYEERKKTQRNPRKNSAHIKSAAQRIYFGPEAPVMRAHEVMDVVEKCIKQPSVKVLHSNYVGGVLYVHLESTKDFKEKIGKECVKKLNSKFPKNDIEVFFIDGDRTKKYTLAFRIKKLK
jgi:hypothetical protein